MACATFLRKSFAFWVKLAAFRGTFRSNWRVIALFSLGIIGAAAFIPSLHAAAAPATETETRKSGDRGAAAQARIGRSSGLPLPRFASLKAERARLRRGPGTSYPIDWELTRRGLPVRIIGEYGHWRRLELHDGTRGWMHKILLRGAPTALLLGDDRVLREEPHEAASAVARVDSATPVRVRDCRGAWCSVEVKDIEGWARRASLWGAGSRTE